jgi:hypothetical protein
MSGYVTHINPELYISAGFWSSLHQGLAPCPVDVYLFCKFGIAPIVILSAIIVPTAIIIIRRTNKFKPQKFVCQLKAIKASRYIHILQKH